LLHHRWCGGQDTRRKYSVTAFVRPASRAP